MQTLASWRAAFTNDSNEDQTNHISESNDQVGLRDDVSSEVLSEVSSEDGGVRLSDFEFAEEVVGEAAAESEDEAESPKIFTIVGEQGEWIVIRPEEEGSGTVGRRVRRSELLVVAGGRVILRDGA